MRFRGFPPAAAAPHGTPKLSYRPSSQAEQAVSDSPAAQLHFSAESTATGTTEDICTPLRAGLRQLPGLRVRPAMHAGRGLASSWHAPCNLTACLPLASCDTVGRACCSGWTASAGSPQPSSRCTLGSGQSAQGAAPGEDAAHLWTGSAAPPLPQRSDDGVCWCISRRDV